MYWQRKQSPRTETKNKYAEHYKKVLAAAKGMSKFNATSSFYNGIWYQSAKEAQYAFELDVRVKAGELREWQRQVPIELYVNGHKICTYTIDFVEIDKNGGEMWTEIKGVETADWRLRWKLFDALYPERDKQVIK
jgi:Protein of unknown function (DUF1064)